MVVTSRSSKMCWQNWDFWEPVCHDPERKYKKKHHKAQSYPRLQQFIQLYCYLYTTDTLYSGEIIGRIIHVTLCDAPQAHKYWCGRPERGGGQSSWGWVMVHTSLDPPSSACQRSVSPHTYLHLLRLTWQPHEERNRALLQHLATSNAPLPTSE